MKSSLLGARKGTGLYIACPIGLRFMRIRTMYASERRFTVQVRRSKKHCLISKLKQFHGSRFAAKCIQPACLKHIQVHHSWNMITGNRSIHLVGARQRLIQQTLASFPVRLLLAQNRMTVQQNLTMILRRLSVKSIQLPKTLCRQWYETKIKWKINKRSRVFPTTYAYHK